jgi:iron(III)-salmochelin esterase
MCEREVEKNRLLLPAALLVVLLVQGCFSSNPVPSGSEKAPAAKPSTSRGGSPAPEVRKEAMPMKEGRGPGTAEQGFRDAATEAKSRPQLPHLRPPAPPPISTPGTGPGVEKFTGYRTPGECLVMRSRNVPEAVVAVTLPEDYYSSPDKKYPLVIAFGGAGECAKPPRSGALAWMHYYQTDEAVAALAKNHLTTRDFRGLVSASRLSRYNAELKKHPYRGVILACPYSPLLSPLQGLESPDYEKYIVEELIPELERRYRVASGDIGVDGVSMGGSRSMYYGFKYPEIFRSVGSIQGAFGPYFDLYADLVKKNRETLKERSIQLVTSDGDVMAPAVARMHQLLKANGIPHKYLVLTGPHDYIFNQGPGSIALLVFHDKALHDRPEGPVR